MPVQEPDNTVLQDEKDLSSYGNITSDDLNHSNSTIPRKTTNVNKLSPLNITSTVKFQKLATKIPNLSINFYKDKENISKENIERGKNINSSQTLFM